VQLYLNEDNLIHIYLVLTWFALFISIAVIWRDIGDYVNAIVTASFVVVTLIVYFLYINTEK
jgi:hypothetical protein